MREKLIELLETVVSPKELLCYGEVLVSTSRVADHLITNDVVPVVRCENCHHSYKLVDEYGEVWLCHYREWTESVTPDHFCSYGERRCDHNA